jgi:drug/metabolite transporter (DMT)-like permease
MDMTILIPLICVMLNATIGIIFKYFEKYAINNGIAIITNYFTCVATASVVLGNFAIPTDVHQKSWFWVSIIMGACFIIVFNLIALTVQKLGVVVSTIFQKMSMIAPAILAMAMYGEKISLAKITGLLLAIVSIVLLSYQPGEKSFKSSNLMMWVLPFGTFLGSCFIDTSLFLIEAENIAPSGDIQFTASLFLFAGIFGIIWHLIKTPALTRQDYIKSILGGFVLGIPNFFSIYLLLYLLGENWEGSLLFPVNNVGILVFTALFSYLAFRERISGLKAWGFITAILSILLIAIA